MVEETKKNEVDLDLDDVKETEIQIEGKQEESKLPNLNVGEVDLGYVDHSVKTKEDKFTKKFSTNSFKMTLKNH